MKALALLACLALPLAARAQPKPAADREGLAFQIETWRTRLPHVDPPAPVTTEFEPRLDKIAEAVKKAKTPGELAQPRKDFERWQHDLVLKDFRLQPGSSLTLNQFSARQRELIDAFGQQNKQMARSLKSASAATDGDASRMFYDGQTGVGMEIMLPGHFGSPKPSPVNSEAATPGLRVTDTPPPPASAKPFSFAALKSYFDTSGISDAAVQSVAKIKNEVAGVGRLLTGFAGSCYYGAKWLLIKAHVLPSEVATPEEIGEIGIGSGHAYMMNAALKNSPRLQTKLRVRRLDLKTVKDSEASQIPERTMFVFDRGCAGMSDESGHIEIAMSREKLAVLPASVFYRTSYRGPKYKPEMGPNQILACSDGCAVRSMAYLRTYARRGCLNAYVPVGNQVVSDAPAIE